MCLGIGTGAVFKMVGNEFPKQVDAVTGVVGPLADWEDSPLAHFDYTLDANGNRTAVVPAAGTESYTLDALNRLTGVKYANGDTVSYT